MIEEGRFYRSATIGTWNVMTYDIRVSLIEAMQVQIVSLPSAVVGRHASRLQQQQTVSGSLPRVWFGEQAVRYGIVHDT